QAHRSRVDAAGNSDVRVVRTQGKRLGFSGEEGDPRGNLPQAVRSRKQKISRGSAPSVDDRISMSGRAGPLEKPLALTFGEPAGIGPDISLAAWRLRTERGVPAFYLIADPGYLRERAK